MVVVCLGSAYVAVFIAFLLEAILLMVSIRYCEGEIKKIIVVNLLIKLITLVTFWLLLRMTSGMCVV